VVRLRFARPAWLARWAMPALLSCSGRRELDRAPLLVAGRREPYAEKLLARVRAITLA